MYLYNGIEILFHWIFRGYRADTDLSVQQQFADESYVRSASRGRPRLSVVIAAKTQRRGARVQHCKLTVQPVVQFVQSVLLALDGRALLFQGSPASFRRRWDFLLQEIGVPRNLRVTPGCLRGGGAVWTYRAGVSLTEICWRMRLANLATLGYYLQEVAADSVLADLPRECLQNVRALREYYRAHLGMQA